jgi:hypothetical protein
MFKHLFKMISYAGPKTLRNVRTARGRPRTRLCLESLEGRFAPATLWWNSSTGGSWTNAANWWNSGTGAPATAPPSSSDSVVFKATSGNQSQNQNCTIDSNHIPGDMFANPPVPAGLALVNDFTIETGYTSTITIDLRGMNAVGSLKVGGTLRFDGGDNSRIVGVMSGANRATVTVNGSLDWWTGTFEKLQVDTAVGSSSTLRGAWSKIVSGTQLTNNGTMSWTSGNIVTASSGGKDGDILNRGTFEMRAAYDLGTGGSPVTGILANYGTLKKLESYTSTVKIPFGNWGQFYVTQGTVKFDTVAGQGSEGVLQEPSPLTQMNGGTLSMGEGAYKVYDGVFEGIGTVNGGLSNFAGILKVGLGEVPGTLTVTGDYTQTNGAGLSGKTEIFINGSGVCSLLSVTGAATLAGNVQVHNNPYTGTVAQTFMTYASKTGTFTIAYDKFVWGPTNGWMWYFVDSQGNTSCVLTPTHYL